MIYADNAATTRPDSRVCELMDSLLRNLYGNPSSIHSMGRESSEAISLARTRIASLLHCKESEIFFTSGGTESDNWAIRCALKMSSKNHVITSPIEHPAVLNTLKEIGCEVSFLKVDRFGRVDPDSLLPLVRPNTALISVMAANNELGTIQPISVLAEFSNELGIPFHTDAVQAVGHIPINFSRDGISMLSLSGHKFNAPKGIGALIIKEGFGLPPMITGGGQEKGSRAGTENLTAICGMGLAASIASQEWKNCTEYVSGLRDDLSKMILEGIPSVRIHSPNQNVLPGILNLSFAGVAGEALLLLLDLKNVCVSTGSACTTGKRETSHVLKAIGLSESEIQGAIRISLDRFNTKSEIEQLYTLINESVSALRKMNI